jgi:N-acetylmuramoyl-L-alanine amidase/Secretion system C-terminal sorting domain
MKNNLTLIVLCLLFVSSAIAQNGQNIAFDLAKKNKKITADGMKTLSTGTRGIGSLTTSELAVELKNPEPFIAFSLSITGTSLAADAIKIELQTLVNGKWSDWQTIEENHDFEQNTKKFVTNMRELDKATTAIRVKTSSESTAMRLKTLKIRLFAAGNVSTGDVNTTTPEGLCVKPPAVSRGTWGAGLGLTNNIFSGSPTFVNVTHLIVHHSATGNTSSNWAAVVASFFDTHVNTNGWADIGYNYLIAPDGTLFVGRGGGENVQGAHFCGFNANTMGICMIGTYTTEQPTAIAVDKLKKVLAWKASEKGIDPTGRSLLANYGVTYSNISGHRDGCSTSCPGDLLYAQLPTMQLNVKTEIATCGTATNDLFAEGSLRIAPNPNNGQFTISAVLKEKTGDLPLFVTVYGLDGKAIYEKTIEATGIDINQNIQLPKVPSGLYLVRLRSGDKAFSEKIQVF